MSTPSLSEAPVIPPSPFKEIGSDLIHNPALWLEQSLKELTIAIYSYLPSLLGAVATLLIGWLSAFVLRWLIHRFGKGLDAILTAVQRWLGHKASRTRWSISSLVGNVVFWITIAYAVSAAAEQLGLLTLSSWVLGLIGYLPRVLISIFILLIGYLVSDGARNMVETTAVSSGFQHGPVLGRMVAGLILAFSLLLGLAQLGLDVTVFANIITLAAAALFLSAALAFGIGAADAVRNVMASHYVRKAYHPGQRVRLQQLEGIIVEITQTDVALDTAGGDARIPARRFMEDITFIITEEETESA